MNILYQIYYSIKRILMDTKAVVLKLASFLIIILILGSAFSSSFEALVLDSVKIFYCSDDEGTDGQAFINQLVKSDAFGDMVTFSELPSYEKGEESLLDDKGEAFLYIPKDFTELAADDSKTTEIEVYTRKYSGISLTIVENVLESYTNGLNAAYAYYKLNGSLEGFEFSMSDGLDSNGLKKSENTTSMTYYSVSMLLMLILYGAEYGCVGAGEELLGSFGKRKKIAPIKVFEQYLGMGIGYACATFVQAIIVILFTHFAYNVSWGNNIPALLLLVFVYSILATALGALICVFTGDMYKALPILNFIIIGFTFISGGFIANDFGTLELFSPSHYAKSAILNLIYGKNAIISLHNIGVLCGIIVVLLLFIKLLTRRKEA